MTIGERIKARRIELGYSANELANKLGKNRATIYRYESNEIENLPITVLEPLANALETTPGHLMGWDDPEKRKADAEKLADVIVNNPKIVRLLEIATHIPADKIDMVVQMLNGLIKGDKDGD